MLTSARDDVFQEAARARGWSVGCLTQGRRTELAANGRRRWPLGWGVAETFLLLVSQGFNSHVTVVVQRAWWR